MASIASFESSSKKHDVLLVNYGHIKSKREDKAGYD